MFFAFDCEGPITLNDNAFEFCKAIIPKGDLFFSKISLFDDYIAEIKKKPGYKAGNTLKLILPFLKLFGANNKILKEFSEKTILFLPYAPQFLKNFKNFNFFIISTSYKPYLEALCKITGFPLDQVFCTEVNFDEVEVSKAEKKILEKLFIEIQNMPFFNMPPAKESDYMVIERLEEIFFEEIPKLDIGHYFMEVNPIGGEEKAKVCEYLSKELNIPLENGLYCGDSITDAKALSLLREKNGISIAFNANRYALKSAEFFVLSEDAKILEDICKEILEKGKNALLSFLNGKTVGKIPKEEEAFKKLVEQSESFRKKIRGIHIGSLG